MKNNFEIRGDQTAIFLNRKNGDVLETIIDTADLGLADTFPATWCAHWSSTTQSFYCYGKLRTPDGKRISVFLHRWITDCSTECQIDHFDNDTLNNRRRSNLRIASRSENHQNRAGAQRNNRSGVRGVSWNVRKRKWQVQIKVSGQRLFLGYFTSIAMAEAAVKLARQTFMPFSKEAAI